MTTATLNTNLAVYMKTQRMQKLASTIDSYIRVCPHAKVIHLYPKDVQALDAAIKKATDGKLSVFDCKYKGRNIERYREVA